MHFGDWSDFDFSFRETAEGYTINIKGDKQKLKPKLEAIEAYVNFRRKASAAGVGKYRHRTMPGRLLSSLHRHFGAAHHVIGNIRRYSMEEREPAFEQSQKACGRRRGFKKHSL